MKPIVIVDYGMGNSGSVLNMLKRIGRPAIVSGDVSEVDRADKIILPGVGAFDHAMRQIRLSGLRAVLDRKALDDAVPILGICLGMQLLTRGSEEGGESGLGWIPGEARRFPANTGLKIPHMGWNLVTPAMPSDLTVDMPAESRFYFVHSYYVQVERPKHSILKASYGIEFDAAIQRENIFGVQFHPEKSHKFGVRLLMNFANI